MSDDPQRPATSRIAWEILIYALLFLVFGAAFVALRVKREGPRVLELDPRRAR